MKRTLYTLLFLMGCGTDNLPATDCLTRCGVAFQTRGNETDWSCEYLQEVEDYMVDVFSNGSIKDDRFLNACGEFFAFTVSLVPDNLGGDRGRTDCKRWHIWISKDLLSAELYSHEIAHAIQDCNADGPSPHYNWDQIHIWQAIDNIDFYFKNR